MHWCSYTSSPRSILLTILLIGAAVLFQNCGRDDDAIDPTRKYHCPQENFTNDCDAYQGIEKSLGYGHIGFEAAAPTFVPGNSDEIIFTYDNNEDKLEPSQIIRYNWRTQEKTILIEESPMIHAYDISPNGWVSAEVSSGPIIYFHLDSPPISLQEIPFDGEIVRDPAWLGNSETIVYLTDNHERKFKMVSYNIKTQATTAHEIPIEGLGNILTYSMTSSNHFVVSKNGDGFYKVDFNDLTRADLLISYDETSALADDVYLSNNGLRIYYNTPYSIHYGEEQKEWNIRALCFGHEQVKYMDVSDDEKHIVYMFEYPVEFSGGKQILASKLRIIDIENCKEYDINPFE